MAGELPENLTAPRPTLAAMLPNLSVRKRLLFGAACCRRAEGLLGDERVRKGLVAIEAFADGATSVADLVALHPDLHAAAFEAFDGRYCAEADAKFTTHPAYSLASAVESAVYAVCTLFEEAVGDLAPPVVDLSTVRGPAPHEHARHAIVGRFGSLALLAFDPDAPGCYGRRRTKRHRIDSTVCRWVGLDEEAAQLELALDMAGPDNLLDAANWRTTDTLGLARAIYEDRKSERMPLLGDALMDAGCTDERVLGHCRFKLHVPGCWVVDMVLGKE
jgi:hypothetical protein